MEFTVTSVLEMYNAIDAINNPTNSDPTNTINIDGILDFNAETQNLILDTKTIINGINPRKSGIILPHSLQIQVNHDDFECNNILVNGAHNGLEIPDGDPNSGGFYIADRQNATFTGCEIRSFSYYGILFRRSTGNVYNSWFHENQKNGLGYGIVLEGNGFANVQYCVMDNNRHCIAGTGEVGQGYIIGNSILGRKGGNNSSRLDMHGAGEITGGTYIKIHDNIFLNTNNVDIGIRGIPTNNIIIENNIFAHKCEKDAISQQQNQFAFGRLQFKNMVIRNNIYDTTACSVNNVEDRFLVTETDGNAYIMQFNSDCRNHSIKKKVGVGFTNFKDIFISDWLGNGNKDILVRTQAEQFRIIPNKDDSYFNIDNSVTVARELREYHILKQGKIVDGINELIGQKEDNNIYSIKIDISDGSITETLILNNSVRYSELILGRFNDLDFDSALGYTESGDSYYHDYAGSALTAGVLLGNYPGHVFHDVFRVYASKDWQDIISHDGNNIYMWRFAAGALLDGGAPTIRSGSSPDTYDKLLGVNYNGVETLCAFKKISNVEVLPFSGSFSDAVHIGAVEISSVIKY